MSAATGPPIQWTVPVGAEATRMLVEEADGPAGVLILAHGAGGHMEHRTIQALARELHSRGLTVVRFNFLYREREHGPPDPMPRLRACYEAVAAHVREALHPRRLFLGGHSMGGRVASLLAADGQECDGLVLLSYPLHPAGRPEQMRDAHLPRIVPPVLCLNGTRDALCERARMEVVLERLRDWEMHWLDGADHGYAVLKRSGRTGEDVLREIGETVGGWVQARGGKRSLCADTHTSGDSGAG